MKPTPAVHHRAAPAVALALALGASAFSCQDPLEPPASDQVVVAFGLDTSAYPTDDWSLVDAAVLGDTMDVGVEYGGGCRDHLFWLLAVDDWVYLPDSGPAPTLAVPLKLAHEAHGDPCESVVRTTLHFDLSPLRSAYRARFGDGAARILLQLPGGRDSVETFVYDWFL